MQDLLQKISLHGVVLTVEEMPLKSAPTVKRNSKRKYSRARNVKFEKATSVHYPESGKRET